ncbi:MAG: SDR family NAD(P)-dependent oxidoreductase, partial [Candidatus Acidiferrales bacterium]
MNPRFAGKVVVIVGGNSGIGLASAKAFAAEGALVVISGRDAATLRSAAQEIGSAAVAIQSDITDLQQIDSLMNEVQRRHGRIDVLFVNAG